MTNYTTNINNTYNSIELQFDCLPTIAEREALKGLKFRWNPRKAIWYGFATIEEVQKALAGEATPAKAEKKPSKKPAKVNKYGVKVGDLFVASWGYEQTNLNYYQVTEILGAEYVMISEVYPVISEEKNYTGMSRDVTVLDPCGMMLEKKQGWTIAIEDNEKGAKRKVKNCGTAEKPSLFIDVDSVIFARKQTGNHTYYESWYY